MPDLRRPLPDWEAWSAELEQRLARMGPVVRTACAHVNGDPYSWADLVEAVTTYQQGDAH